LVEVQVRPFYDSLIKPGRHSDINIDEVDATQSLGNAPNVIPPALEINFQEAVPNFEPAGERYTAEAEPKRSKFLREFVGQFREPTEAFQEPFKAIETHFGYRCLGPL
jgi:hypothetical protein